MRSLRSILAITLGMCIYASSAYAYYDPKKKPADPSTEQVNFREACVTAGAQIDQDVNNVRARLTTGGDVWWDRSDGKYVVPKVDPGQQEVSSIFAGAVWLGGFDDGGNLKVACQTYGNGSNNSDFWPGPLRSDADESPGTTDKEICDNWDRFWEVDGRVIQAHIEMFDASLRGELDYTEDMLDPSIKGWPGDNNPYFFDVNGFDLPNPEFGYNNFYDFDSDGDYDPLKGDFPAIIIRGCEEFPPQYPDEMIFWVYNDEGGGAIHGETEGTAIRMEVQVQAFGYATNDQINDMTFQRYRLNNRALEDLDSTYFAMWVDADLGCYLDDYIGCDTSRSLAYTYNEDAIDGDPGCTGIGVYGETVPIIGIDYFRGPLDEQGNELGMSSFTYFNNPSFGQPAPDVNTTDPSIDTEFYNYLSGRWKFGQPFTFGGNGFNPTSQDVIKYAFVSDPDEGGTAWSMCTASLPAYDRRTVQASGPFRLQRGAVNELIIGAVWVPDLSYPCPDISRLQVADDIAQDLFDNCFDIVDGPDAPDVDWIELDRKLVAVLSNGPSSNNFQERYQEAGIGFPMEATDTTYNFEGYLLYQLANPNVGTADFDNPELAKLVAQVDIENGLSFLYNWTSVPNPNFDPTNPASSDVVWFPEVKVEGADQGIRHTFEITIDQFATGDRRLLNHRKYYFSALAYAHNEFEPFDFVTETGQKVTYLEGRRNIRTYAPIPRPITDVQLNADYGDGAIITRLDGIGAGGNFLDISDETRSAILDGSFDGAITYKEGRGPVNVAIYNPLEVVNGDYEITFIDANMSNDKFDDPVFWQLTNLADGSVIVSDTSLDLFNEQIFGQYGFSVSIGQTADVGDWADPSDGGIGAEITYGSNDQSFWFSGIQDGFEISDIEFSGVIFDYIRHRDGWENRDHEVLGTLGQGFFVPYQITDFEDRTASGGTGYYLTPAWRDYGGGQGELVMDEDLLNNLNNVDIVFTSDKNLWSRCVVVETMAPEFVQFELNEFEEPWDSENDFGGPGQFLEGEPILQFDLRAQASVSKEADANGLPIPDGELDEDGDPLIGMGWFPGYAINVETGKRVNVFFGENSAYSEANGNLSTYNNGRPNGADMMFNPTSQITLNGLPGGDFRPANYFAGGHHYVYVTTEDYDECEYLRGRLTPKESNVLRKVAALKRVTWAGLPVVADGQRLLSYGEGLIPNELTYKLRVDNPYSVEVGTGIANGYPTYQFSIEGKEATPLDEVGIENALDMINVVPNPYYAYSEYEISRLSTIVKITNLPAKCVVTIYTLDGKFIRQYNRDEQPGTPQGNAIPSAQVVPDLEWDLKNNKGIPISAGIYLIHVDAPGYGERTLKWFGVNRKFDPSGL